MTFQTQLELIPEGSGMVIYQSQKYLMTKETLQKGSIIKVYARSLSGSDFISFNYYLTSNEALIKPCEMSLEKVQDFVEKIKLIESF